MHKAKELIDNNFLGKVRTVNINCQMFKPNNYFKEANWKKNEKVIIVPAVSDEEAKETFGEFEKIKPYLRFTRLDDS